MLTLEPELAIMDETDSGLDIDALKIVSEGVNHMRAKDRGFLVITHYQRLLDYIKPDRVHVLAGGACAYLAVLARAFSSSEATAVASCVLKRATVSDADSDFLSN